MDHIFVLGSCAGIFTTIAFLPQVIKAHQTKHTKDLSLVMYLLFSLGLILWTVYGFILGSFPVIAANSITLALSSYIVFLKIKYG
jgi:MtN3 and saliva related transmembrane protein